jgi:hypothetical protein
MLLEDASIRRIEMQRTSCSLVYYEVLVCEGAYVYAMELFVKTDVNKVSQQGF